MPLSKTKIHFPIRYPNVDAGSQKIFNYWGVQYNDPFRWLEDTHTDKVRQFVTTQNALTDKFLQKSRIEQETVKSGLYFSHSAVTDAKLADESKNRGDGCSDASILNTRDLIHSRVANLWMHCDHYNCPFKRGDRYFYQKNGVLYMSSTLTCLKSDKEEDKIEQGQIVLDPDSDFDRSLNLKVVGKSSEHKIRKKGHIGLTHTSKAKTEDYCGDSMISVSNDGKVLAYGLSADGSIWSTIFFKNLDSGLLFKDELKSVPHDTFLAWTSENDGLFYARYPKDVAYGKEKIYYHRLGTNQSNDLIVFELNEKPGCQLKPRVTDCGGFLLVHVEYDWKFAARMEVYCAEMTSVYSYVDGVRRRRGKFGAPFQPLVLDVKGEFGYITSSEDALYFLTNQRAPNFKVVTYPLATGDNLNEEDFSSEWSILVPQHKKHVLDWALASNKKYLFTCYIQDTKTKLQLRHLSDGQLLYQFPLDIGTITEYSAGLNTTDCFFKFSSYLVPDSLYRVNLDDQYMLKCRKYRNGLCSCFSSEVRFKYKIPVEEVHKRRASTDLDLNNYTVEQISYVSNKHMTKVQMFLVHKKNMKRNGMNPLLLHCYGGLHTQHQHAFDPPIIFFVEHFDGIYAVANIRGTRGHGEEWYQEGAGPNKQNSLHDFQNAAKYLVRARYTCPEKLAIWGYSSNGGLIAAASANQNPSLFGAVIVEYGALDLIRLQQYSFGPGWAKEFGNVDVKSEFNELIRISPVHNVQLPSDDDTEQYPAMLIITAENDQVLSPMHAYKMAAQLQTTVGRSSKQTNPLLLRVEDKVGFENEGKTTETAVEELTDILTFIALSLDLTCNP